MHCNQDKVGVQQAGLQFTLNGFINVLMLSAPPDLMTFQIDDSRVFGGRLNLDYVGNF